MRRQLAAVLCLLLSGLPAAAAPAGAPPPARDAIVEELVVTAGAPNPAWWEVRNGESVVYVLGGPMAPLPKDVRWDDTPLRKRLEGAKALLLPPGGAVGIGDLFGLLRLRGQLKEKTPLEQSLSPALAARFAAARSAIGKPATRYDNWNPVVAGGLLQRDYFDHWKLSGGTTAVAAARNAAGRQKVEVQRITHRFMPVLKSAAREMREEEKAEACLAGYLETAEAPPQRYRAAAEAWARGDVRKAIDVPHGADVCRELFMNEFSATSIADQVEAITEALQTPGKAVAVVPLRQLIVRGGVLQQLKDRGFEVAEPVD